MTDLEKDQAIMNDVEKDLATMNEIKEYLINRLNAKYDYCGVAQGENMVMLNSGRTNLIIKIELKP